MNCAHKSYFKRGFRFEALSFYSHQMLLIKITERWCDRSNYDHVDKSYAILVLQGVCTIVFGKTHKHIGVVSNCRNSRGKTSDDNLVLTQIRGVERSLSDYCCFGGIGLAHLAVIKFKLAQKWI